MHPRLRDAIPADARVTAAHRFERHEFRSRADVALQVLRLCLVTDAFLAQCLYRVKARLQDLGVPVLPRIAHRLAIVTGQVSIGDPAVVHPGVYLVHGQVVIDGPAVVHGGTSIAPFVTIGVRGTDLAAPEIGPFAAIGTGARVLGGVRVGQGAQVGANAVVLDDVEPGATVVGAPARPVP
jgi:serine O-acetyltransferase